MNTETGSSQQRGIASFAYGIHRYIRNPQFHGHYFNEEDIVDILIIISFVTKKLNLQKQNIVNWIFLMN
ncbi:TIGR02391 family protein [Brachyspira hyodysenteriae]|uniref:TIGR02391 family protein n=1 Tax=Brachyspira hyodysenteriae TaxID=159 RepID=UPI0022CD9C04|nr:TIGR02391 family protein [Brachyspira hyodysenteriae]MDA0000858.1 TIGR02391 family protein [Brachyspira hyodysenteriae]MDA0048385.1 TIGR02391 family protein [Brachyspira hyodysenteriae]MDA0089142.1 TIGR02391 family protein [Brachyspira hyodysenteriae]MDA0095388.1 TIGR02391 family protein [Brachyspira hyodysenteriae]